MVTATAKACQDLQDYNRESSTFPPILIGLSACLAGQRVRYDGGHTRSHLCLDTLSEHLTFKPFCPEVAAGFGTPRPTMRLTGTPDAPQLAFNHNDAINLTSRLVKGFSSSLSEMRLCDGYILMTKSPSCGLGSVKVYQPDGQPHQQASSGLFAQALKASYPLMPIEEEASLRHDVLLDNFLLRIYAHNNFRREVLNHPTLHRLIQFHSRYKYVVMSHSQAAYRSLGTLLGSPNDTPIGELTHSYFKRFMAALRAPASRNNHANTLLHILGYLKQSIPGTERRRIVAIIDSYKDGSVPLATPLTLLAGHLSQHGSSYINMQHYFNPYPKSIRPTRHRDLPHNS